MLSMGFDGRTETRVKKTMPVRLVVGEEARATEWTFTVNVSPGGARVATKRPWRLGQEAQLAAESGEFRIRGRVVYC